MAKYMIPVVGGARQVIDTGASPGRRGDTIPARIDGRNPAALRTGEYVIPPEVVAALGGKAALDHLVLQATGKPPQGMGMPLSVGRHPPLPSEGFADGGGVLGAANVLRGRGRQIDDYVDRATSGVSAAPAQPPPEPLPASSPPPDTEGSLHKLWRALTHQRPPEQHYEDGGDVQRLPADQRLALQQQQAMMGVRGTVPTDPNMSLGQRINDMQQQAMQLRAQDEQSALTPSATAHVRRNTADPWGTAAEAFGGRGSSADPWGTAAATFGSRRSSIASSGPSAPDMPSPDWSSKQSKLLTSSPNPTYGFSRGGVVQHFETGGGPDDGNKRNRVGFFDVLTAPTFKPKGEFGAGLAENIGKVFFGDPFAPKNAPAPKQDTSQVVTGIPLKSPENAGGSAPVGAANIGATPPAPAANTAAVPQVDVVPTAAPSPAPITPGVLPSDASIAILGGKQGDYLPLRDWADKTGGSGVFSGIGVTRQDVLGPYKTTQHGKIGGDVYRQVPLFTQIPGEQLANVDPSDKTYVEGLSRQFANEQYLHPNRAIRFDDWVGQRVGGPEAKRLGLAPTDPNINLDVAKEQGSSRVSAAEARAAGAEAGAEAKAAGNQAAAEARAKAREWKALTDPVTGKVVGWHRTNLETGELEQRDAAGNPVTMASGSAAFGAPAASTKTTAAQMTAQLKGKGHSDSDIAARIQAGIKKGELQP